MAYSLSGERPGAAASHRPKLGALFAWFKRAHRARSQRLAFAALLEMDESRLLDLGISRADLFAAMDDRSGGGTKELEARRASNTRIWSPRR